MIYEEKDDYLIIKKDEDSISFIKITQTKVYLKPSDCGNIYQYDLKYFYENIECCYCYEFEKNSVGNIIKRELIFYFINNDKNKIESDIDNDIDTLFLMEKINKKIKYFLDKEKRGNCFF